MRETDDALKKSHESLVSIMDSLDAIVYVADMETYELLFVNKYSRAHLSKIDFRKTSDSGSIEL